MTAEDVERSVIRRLRLSQPPGYMKGNQAAIDEELALYRRSLARFDRDVLEGAWLEAASRNAYRCWPSCAAILTAAERLHEAAHPPAKPDDSWVERAQGLADDAVRRFLRSSRYAETARQKGYEPELRRYVAAQAWVQGQYLAGRQGVAYDHGVLFPGRERDREAEEQWFAQQRAQASTGSIRITLPRGLIDGWRKAAEACGRAR